jgi:adenosylcobinamide-phosphate guanylyltransferase
VLALIMAGGRGTRLQMGEKGLVRLCHKPLIEYVTEALEAAGMEPVVVTTAYTPYTSNYCRARGIAQVCTPGSGYIEDITEAVTILEEGGPVLTICVDIPGITGACLKGIVQQYQDSTTEACSVWIPSELCQIADYRLNYTMDISGIPVIPAGINILLGEKIGQVQTELQIILRDPLLAFNINTKEELRAAEIAFGRT